MSTQRAGRGKIFRNWLMRDEGGSVAVEFALIIPVFLSILFGIMQFGYVLVVQNSMTNAAREGARAMAIQQATTEDGVAMVRSALERWSVEFDVEAETQIDPAGRNEVSVVVSLPLSEIGFGDYLGVFTGRRIEAVASMLQD
jgi:Flp pilus assembly pilin Flp